MKKLLDNENGVSLRSINSLMTTVSIVISLMLVTATFLSSLMFRRMSVSSEDYMIWLDDASQLMNASDYLTQEVQCYTVTLERSHLDNYFYEANENRRREAALDAIPEDQRNTPAYSDLLKAMDNSLHLMEREYYAMALICNAVGADLNAYPQEIRDVKIAAEDLALSRQEKIQKAQTMVHDKEYYIEKENIRAEMNACIEDISTTTRNTQAESLDLLEKQLGVVRILIAIYTLGIMLTFFLTSKLGILPILKGVEKIDKDAPIPEIGAKEFRYLARSYNKMYDTYRESIAHLNYDVSHDALTGLYNREGYEILKGSIDIKNTTLIIVDVDDFKGINDSHGHDVGDRILQKIAASLRNNFRDDDHICRIGGDEFVVFMIHAKTGIEKLIGKKIARINKDLARTEDGLPEVSVSAGAAMGREDVTEEELFKHADEALYEVKKSGKSGWSFYRP